MVRSALWGVRGIGLVLIGIGVFAPLQRHPTQFHAEVAGFIVAAAVLALWAFVDRSAASRARVAGWLPWALALMAVASGAVSETATGGPLLALTGIAVISAGSDMSIAAGWTVLVAGVLAVEAGALVVGRSSWTDLGYPLLLLVALLVGHSRRSYRVQAEQSAAMLAQIVQLRAEQHRVDVLDERARIAREIHDVLAHSLGALGVQIQAARAVLEVQGDRVQTLELLDQAQRMATDGLAETRRAVHALRTDTPPLPDVVAGLASTHERAHRARVTVAISGDPRPLSPDGGLALTRTAQETLVNSSKHAPRQPIDVHLDYGEARTALTVVNHLADPAAVAGPRLQGVDGGYGLTGLRERLLLLGGTLTAGPDGDRWVVTAVVPQ